jgi:hypothetical protein
MVLVVCAMAERGAQKGSITRKINFILIIALAIGIGATVAYYALTQNQTLLTFTENNLTQQSDIL